MGLKTICGILLASALALTPASTFAQRGAAGAHAGGARPGVFRAPQAPVVRDPAAEVRHPTPARPVITRLIITRPTGIRPITPFSDSVVPFLTPLTPVNRLPCRLP